MINIYRKMGIIDPETGNIIFVSREEACRHLKKSTQHAAVLPADAIKTKLSGNKEPGI